MQRPYSEISRGTCAGACGPTLPPRRGLVIVPVWRFAHNSRVCLGCNRSGELVWGGSAPPGERSRERLLGS